MSYRHPADIDGEPDEVAAAALVSLADITQAAHEVASAALTQVRNAALDAVDAPELSGQAVYDWENSGEGRALEGLARATAKAHRIATVLSRRRPEEPPEEVGSATVVG